MFEAFFCFPSGALSTVITLSENRSQRVFVVYLRNEASWCKKHFQDGTSSVIVCGRLAINASNVDVYIFLYLCTVR